MRCQRSAIALPGGVMPISRIYDELDAKKLGFFEDEKDGPEIKMQRVAVVEWIYPDQMELLKEAYGRKLDAVIKKQFTYMLEDLYQMAEREIDKRNTGDIA
jgi:hypothetical protein